VAAYRLLPGFIEHFGDRGDTGSYGYGGKE
jgi:hypothetical protein